VGVSEEPFEVELAAGSYSLKVKGFRPIAQISQYLADAVGVIGEPLGLAKDSLKRFRIHRDEAAAAALLRAKEIAQEDGSDLVRKISPKLLAPWIEGASFEDTTEENILELWAQILATAPDGFSPVTIAFMEICKRIGPREAQVLGGLVNFDLYTAVKSNGDGSVVRFLNLDGITERNSLYISRIFSEFLRRNKDLQSCSNRVPMEIFSLLEKRIVGRMESFLVDSNKYGWGRHGVSGSRHGVSEEVLGILEFAGVTHRRELTITSVDGRKVKATWCEPTSMGLRFFEIINRRKLIIEGSLDSHFSSLKLRKV